MGTTRPSSHAWHPPPLPTHQPHPSALTHTALNGARALTGGDCHDLTDLDGARGILVSIYYHNPIPIFT